MVKKVALVVVILSIYGCGGGEDKSEAPPPVVAEKLYINGIEVPPEPNEKLNNSTISGIDTDGNGIRDDIDRRLAESFGREPERLNIAKKESAYLQSVIVSGGKDELDRYHDFINCINDEQILIDMDKINSFMLNTSGRRSVYKELFAGSVGNIGEECDE